MQSPFDECVATIRRVIASGDVCDIQTAQDAIAAFVAGHKGPNRKTGVLNVLDQELDKEWRTAEGGQADVIARLSEYVSARTQRLKDQK